MPDPAKISSSTDFQNGSSPRVPIREVAILFLKLGFLAFGGPRGSYRLDGRRGGAPARVDERAAVPGSARSLQSHPRTELDRIGDLHRLSRRRLSRAPAGRRLFYPAGGDDGVGTGHRLRAMGRASRQPAAVQQPVPGGDCHRDPGSLASRAYRDQIARPCDYFGFGRSALTQRREPAARARGGEAALRPSGICSPAMAPRTSRLSLPQ